MRRSNWAGLYAGSAGMVRARSIPESVACTPVACTATQSSTPTAAYGIGWRIPSSIEYHQNEEEGPRRSAQAQVQLGGVEERDHEYRAEVVGNGERREEYDEIPRDAPCEQGQDPHGEGDVATSVPSRPAGHSTDSPTECR